MKHRRFAWGAAGLMVLGCMGDNNGSGCAKISGPSEPFVLGGCPSGATVGSAHGLRPDGRVDVGAAEAWPSRTPEAPRPTPPEVAEACAAFAACVDVPIQDGGVPFLGGDVRHLVFANCLAGSPSIPANQLFGINTAERAVLLDGSNESWSFFIRSVLAAHGRCEDVGRVLTERRAAIGCQEDGCYWAGDDKPTVSCEGDVATLTSASAHLERDCSRAGTRCSTTSATGCTDRPLVECNSDGHDRCDGDIKLGCDGCGRVSFHDCSWNGGHCVETSDGAGCVDPGDRSSCVAMPHGCDGTKLSVCVSGEAAQVDCAAIGMDCKPVTSGSTVHRPDGGTLCLTSDGCTGAVCVPRAGGSPDAG